MISLTHARGTIRAADARFFLALVLNVPTRAPLMRLLRERDPGIDPVTCVMGSVRELSGALGCELGEDAELLLECVLRSPSGRVEEAFAMFAVRRGISLSPTYMAELHGALADLRDSRLLRPLLVD